MASRVIVGLRVEPVNVLRGCDKVGVKVPQFFSRFASHSASLANISIC